MTVNFRLDVHCSRLWIRLGEMIIARDDACCYLQQHTFQSTAQEYNGLANNIVSSNDSSAKGSAVLNRLSSVAPSGVGEKSVPGAVCTGCPSLSVDDGPMLQFSAPTSILKSLTCFAAAV